MGIRLSILTVEDPCCVAWLGRGVGYMRTLRHLGPLFLTLHRPPVARHAAVALPGDKGVAPCWPTRASSWSQTSMELSRARTGIAAAIALGKFF
jgi:hypothetical protein